MIGFLCDYIACNSANWIEFMWLNNQSSLYSRILIDFSLRFVTALRPEKRKTNIKLRHDVFMSINWTIVFKTHICWSDGGLSLGITASNVKECYPSVRQYKSLVTFSKFPLSFTIAASVSLGENIFTGKLRRNFVLH